MISNNKKLPFRYDNLSETLMASLNSGILIKNLLNTLLILSNKCSNWNILDFGSGYGGLTAALSAEGLHVDSIEINEDVIYGIKYWQLEYSLPFRLNPYYDFMESPEVLQYDLCILREVLEHIEDINVFFKVLNHSNRIFLTTPNRYSFFLLPRDPHNFLPIVSMLTNRSIINRSIIWGVVNFLKWSKIGKLNATLNTKLNNFQHVNLFTTFEIETMLKSHGYTKIMHYSQEYFKLKNGRKWLYVFSKFLPRSIWDKFISPAIVIYAEKPNE